jgi:beta-lactamase superfamily II metal-dependent hydrolase
MPNNNVTLYAFDAENGDCLLLVNGMTGFSILIDSGPEKRETSEALTSSIKKIIKGSPIDLAIVTHNDDDHIGGFKYFMENGIEIKKFIFNSHDFVNKLDVIQRNVKVSYRQDKLLHSSIREKIIELQFDGKSGYFSGMTFDTFDIKFRSPNRAKLIKYKSWLVNKERNRKVANTITSLSLDDCKRLAKTDNSFIEDSREPNGSSLALDISFGDNRLLLLGDAHPTTVINSLNNDNETNHKYDLVKVSHHGSNKNTNNKLLSLIECENFLVCSNATNNHGHPSPITLTRIVLSNSNSKLYVTKENDEMKGIETDFELEFNYPDNGVLEFNYEL